MACPLPVIDTNTRILLEQGMYDLALIDHGSGPTDRIKRIMMAPGVFDKALREIVNQRPGFQVLKSDWFDHQRTSLYQTQVQIYQRANIPRETQTTTYLMFQGVDLGKLGGHYAAYYITPTTVTVHDSMITSEGNGAYTPFFLKLGQDLFPNHRVEAEVVGRDEIGLQPTGGFLWLLPSFMKHVALKDPFTTQLLQTSNIESQDHFCWSWSLLYLHSRVVGQSLVPLRQRLKRTGFPQVAIIKMYTWLLLTWLGLDSSFPEADKADYFCVWDARDRLNVKDYRRYDLSFRDELVLREVDDCLRIVMGEGSVVLRRVEGVTEVPRSCLA